MLKAAGIDVKAAASTVEESDVQRVLAGGASSDGAAPAKAPPEAKPAEAKPAEAKQPQPPQGANGSTRDPSAEAADPRERASGAPAAGRPAPQQSRAALRWWGWRWRSATRRCRPPAPCRDRLTGFSPPAAASHAAAAPAPQPRPRRAAAASRSRVAPPRRSSSPRRSRSRPARRCATSPSTSASRFRTSSRS